MKERRLCIHIQGPGVSTQNFKKKVLRANDNACGISLAELYRQQLNPSTQESEAGGS